MRKSLFIAWVLAAICIIPSCKKESLKDKVVFGDTQGMSVTSYDSVTLVEQYSHTSWGYSLDLNGDGQDDIQFHSEILGSIQFGQDIVTTLACINENVALLGYSKNQVLYLHIDSTFHTEDSVWWDVNVYKTYTCEAIDETDQVVQTNEKFALLENDANDNFDKDYTFKNTNVILKGRSQTYFEVPETVDHVLYTYQVNQKGNCDVFPMDEVKYIGFKITENDKSRLGWMKIILHHDSVEPLETAIQK